MSNKIFDKILGRESAEDKFERESKEYAQMRIEAFAAQPADKQEVMATYDAHFDPLEPDYENAGTFDLNRLQEGGIMRLTLGYDIEKDSNGSTPYFAGYEKFYIYVIAGKKDKEGKIRLYEVEYGYDDENDVVEEQLNSNLELKPVGFRLQHLNYKDKDKKYNGKEFPIYRAKDYLKLRGKDWEFGAEIPNNPFPHNTLWPDNYLASKIDIMAAGEKEKRPDIEAVADSAPQGLRRQSLNPVPTSN
jgi:hypothetical protein